MQTLRNSRQTLLTFVGYAIPILLLGSLRLWAEYRIGATPIGYDSSNPYITSYLTYTGSFLESITSFHLLYYLFSVARRLDFDALITIKATGIFLYLMLNVSFLMIIKNICKFRPLLVWWGVLLFGLQLSTLRFSWDLFRNELALIFLLWSIYSMVEFYWHRSPIHLVMSIISGILVLTTHQMVSFVMVIAALAGLFQITTKKLPRQWMTYGLIFLIVTLWPTIMKHIVIAGLWLWVPAADTTPYQVATLPLSLFLLLYFPLLFPLAVAGVIKKPMPGLLLVTSLILVQSFSLTIFKDESAQLWDRWMYFLGIPFTIYALFGIEHVLQGKIYPKVPDIIIVSFISALTAAPAWAFFDAHLTLYRRQHLNHEVFNLFPGTFISNAFVGNEFELIRHQNIPQCARTYATIYDPNIPTVAPSTYDGILHYYWGDSIAYGFTIPETGSYQMFGYPFSSRKHIRALDPDSYCPIFILDGIHE